MTIQRQLFLTPEMRSLLKRENIERIVRGEHMDMYSEWLLVGKLHERFTPTLALAFFPDIFYANFTINKQPPEELMRYRTTAHGLFLPERVLEREKDQYPMLIDKGDEILRKASKISSISLLPTAMIVFSQPDELGSESAYLFCPSIVPPSAALRYVKQNTRIDS